MSYAQKITWQTLQQGLFYTQLRPFDLNPFAKIHIFKFSLKDYRLNLAITKKNKRQNLQQVLQKNNGLVAINGGFFSPKLIPLGLRVQNGYIKNPLKPISWWGIFYTYRKKAYIVNYKKYKKRAYDFAIQSGPRLIVNHKISTLKPGLAERTALGITTQGDVLMIATEHAAMSTTQFANLLKNDLRCRYALNLDGGSSTQLIAKINDFSLNVFGYAAISDVVYLTKRK